LPEQRFHDDGRTNQLGAMEVWDCSGLRFRREEALHVASTEELEPRRRRDSVAGDGAGNGQAGGEGGRRPWQQEATALERKHVASRRSVDDAREEMEQDGGTAWRRAEVSRTRAAATVACVAAGRAGSVE
jgi:hypothetical protein